MKANHKLHGGTLTVSLGGEIDESCASSVRNYLDGLSETCGVKKLVLNLGGVSFMDSTGIGVLLGRYKLYRSLGIPIEIESPSYTVDKLLLLSGIYEIMPKVS